MPSLTISQDFQARLLQGMRMVQPRAAECIPGTRKRILADILAKTRDSHSANIIWIRGGPGSGKSSISLSAKSLLHRQRQLVTYFRFDRNDTTAATSTSLWRHVAHDLANRFPSVRPALLLHLRDDEVDLNSPLAVFTSLVEDALSNLNSPVDRPFVIVIDGLDECGGLAGDLSPDRKILLQTLGRWARFPKHFKLLVTSREEGDISRTLSPISTPIDIPSGRSVTMSPDAEASIDTSNDIRIFLEHRFRSIRKRVPTLPVDWPGTGTVSDMVHRAAGNFMCAMSVANFIDRKGTNPQKQLAMVLVMDHLPAGCMSPLYSLYTAILETAFGRITDDESAAGALRCILSTMVLARRPLDDVEYMKLPTVQPVTETWLYIIRDGLRSVIAGPNLCLKFAHQSFEDFLLSEECPSRYRIRTDESQRRLTELCLATMTAELHFNMCGPETPSFKNADVPGTETNNAKSGISALLSYSCCFFAHHLSHTPFDEKLMGKVKAMMLGYLLYWFEAMSLLKKIEQISRSLSLVLQWSRPSLDDTFKSFVRDAHQFIGAFGQPIAQSAPHIYLSALPFAPECSPVARHFLPRFPSILAHSTGKPTDWPSCISTSEHPKAAFSPDEKRIAWSSGEGTLFDFETDDAHRSGSFEGESSVLRVFFNPESRRVLAASSKGDAVNWDVKTEDKLHVFQTGPAIACCRIHGRQTMISVSSQQGMATLTLWNTDTGEQLDNITMDDTTTLASFSPNILDMPNAGLPNAEARISEAKLVEGNGALDPPRTHPQSGRTERTMDEKFGVNGLKDGTVDPRTDDTMGPPLSAGKAEGNVVGLELPGSRYGGDPLSTKEQLEFELLWQKTMKKKAETQLQASGDLLKKDKTLLEGEVMTLKERVRECEERIRLLQWDLSSSIPGVSITGLRVSSTIIPKAPVHHVKSFMAMIRKGAGVTYTKFVLEATLEDPETGVPRSLCFNVNADVLMIAFQSIGADSRPPTLMLTGSYEDETDFAGSQVFTGRIGGGKLFLKIAPNVIITGKIVDGPRKGVSLSGNGSWTSS